MYMVAIAWLYVVILMSFTETSFIGGLMTFLFYGLFPLALFLWLVGTPQRRRNKAKTGAEPGSMAVDQKADTGNQAHPQRDQ
jgi:hypothetical protein